MPLGEIWESLKGTLKTRSKSSFWGAFIVAWCVINWKYFYVTLILTTEEVPYTEASTHRDKLTYLVNEVSWSWDTLLIHPVAAALLVPLIITFADELVSFIVQAIQRLSVLVRSKVNPKITPAPLVKAEAHIEKLLLANQGFGSEARNAKAELVELRGDYEQLHRAHEALTTERDTYFLKVNDYEKHAYKWKAYESFAKGLTTLLEQLDTLPDSEAVDVARKALADLRLEALR